MAMPLTLISTFFVHAVAGEVCADQATEFGATRRVGDSVLLQVAARAGVSRSASARLTCETCVDIFDAIGGCEVWAAEDTEALDVLHGLPEYRGCEDLGCESHLEAHCTSHRGNSTTIAACPSSCGPAFEGAGGCIALSNNSYDRVQEIVSSPELSHCDLEKCDMFSRCIPAEVGEEHCQTCASQFDAAGGCEALLNYMHSQGDGRSTEGEGSGVQAFIPDGCWFCGDEALTHCMGQASFRGNASAKCEECMASLESRGDMCATMSGEAELPGVCLEAGEVCGERVAQRCAADGPEPECHTSRKGEVCFKHVRWAMETGIAVHPEWYPGLSRQSSFEEFQLLLHNQHSFHGCPPPCPELPSSFCHTALPGEECHHHVRWAIEVGIKAMPAMYPLTLGSNLTFVAVQGWLHHIHHGDCFAPCDDL